MISRSAEPGVEQHQAQGCGHEAVTASGDAAARPALAAARHAHLTPELPTLAGCAHTAAAAAVGRRAAAAAERTERARAPATDRALSDRISLSDVTSLSDRISRLSPCTGELFSPG